MRWEKANYGSKYLKAEDLLIGGVWRQATVTITATFEPGTQKQGEKPAGPDNRKTIPQPVIEFENQSGRKKRLVLGKTNERLLQAQTGISKGSELVGRQVTLYPVLGDWFGQRDVTSIRIRIDDGKPRPFIQPANLGKDITGQQTEYTPEPIDPDGTAEAPVIAQVTPPDWMGECEARFQDALSASAVAECEAEYTAKCETEEHRLLVQSVARDYMEALAETGF